MWKWGIEKKKKEVKRMSSECECHGKRRKKLKERRKMLFIPRA